MRRKLSSFIAWGHVQRLWIRTLNREAANDSLRNILAIIGLGTLLGDFAQMRLIFVLPSLCLFFAVWYGFYLRYDLPSTDANVRTLEAQQ